MSIVWEIDKHPLWFLLTSGNVLIASLLPQKLFYACIYSLIIIYCIKNGRRTIVINGPCNITDTPIRYCQFLNLSFCLYYCCYYRVYYQIIFFRLSNQYKITNLSRSIDWFSLYYPHFTLIVLNVVTWLYPLRNLLFHSRPLFRFYCLREW